MPMRWRWPPENSCGKRPAICGRGRPARSSSDTRSRRSRPLPMPWISSGSAMIEPTVMREFSDAYGSWNTICMSRRFRRISLALAFVSSMPSNWTLPAVGL